MNYRDTTKEELKNLQPEQNPKKGTNIKEVKEPKDFSLGKRMAFVLVASIIVSEILIMFIIQRLQIQSAFIEAPIDSFLLAILILPAIYFFVIRPMTIQTARRNQAEVVLKESEKLYRSLFENMLNGFAYCQMYFDDNDKPVDFTYLSVNSAFETQTGLRNVVGKKVTEVIPGIREFDQELLEIYGRVSKTAKAERFEMFVISRLNWFSVSVYSPGAGTFVAIFDVITERKHAEKALNNTMSLMEATLQSIHNGILVVDNQGAVIKTNAKFAEMWQIPGDIVASGDDKKLLESVIGQMADPESFIAKVSELYDKPEAESLDVLNLKDGRIFKRISKPMYLNGEPKGRVWSFLDITERILAEEALLNSKVHLHTLVQTIPDLVWLKDPSSVYLACNAMFERLVGAPEAEIIGKTDYDLFSHENAEFFRGNDSNAIAAGKPTSNEEWLTFADDGHLALLDVIKTPMYDSKGILIGVLGIGHDITERKRMEEALKDSEDKFSKAFQLSPFAITIASAKDGKFVEMNDAFVSLSGYSREEALGRTAIDLDLWESVEDRNRVLSDLFEGRNVKGKEYGFKKRNGETGTGLYSAQIIHLNNEPFILSSINDITYQKETENAIRESEKKYRYMFDNNPQPMWIYDFETLAFLEVNQATVDHYGYSREEFRVMTLNDIRLAEDVPTFLDEIKHYTQVKISGVERRHIKKSGELMVVEITSHSVIYNGREARHVLVNDITLRKNAEELLRETKETLSLYIENSFDVIFTLDFEGTFVFASPAWERHFGFPTSEIIGKSFIPYVHPEDAQPLFEYLNQIFITRKSETSPAYRVRHINGDWRWFICNGTPYFDAKGKPQFIGVGRDITEQRRAESEIKLNNEQLIKAHAEKDKFFSIIAHDLRSPFSSFLGLTQIMDEELSELSIDETHELAHSMRNSAYNLFRLLENLLQWAQMQQGLMPFKPEVLHLMSVVDECTAISSEPAKNKGINLTTDIQDDIMVFADSNALQTIIRNLVSNAMKFTPKRGTICVSAKTSTGKNIEISIRDTGIGMTAEMVDHLFRPDVQTSRKGTEGEPSSGLGLMLCKEFIEKQDGKIWVESEEGTGTTFHFTIPGMK